MDLKAMKATYTVAKMTEQHFNGGYFSEEVRARFAEIENLDVIQKKELFADSFNYAYDLASEIEEYSMPTICPYTFDLRAEGIGIVTVDPFDCSQQMLDNLNSSTESPYRALIVRVETFYPSPEAHDDYRDWLASFRNEESPTTAIKHPNYSEDITLHDDYMTREISAEDLDKNILLTLDMIETLKNVRALVMQNRSQ